MSKIGMNELLQIVKDSFEEQKGIKILSLYFQKRQNTIYGVYILPLEQSLSFTEEPLLDMETDIDGHRIILQELGQMLLYSYHIGDVSCYHELVAVVFSSLDTDNSKYDELIELCRENPPLQRITSNFLNWIEMTDDVHPVRTETFLKICQKYRYYSDIEYNKNLAGFDDVSVRQEFKNVANQLRHKQYKKIPELIMHQINQLYIQLQVDLYMTDHKYYK